mmetsp:Transcript_148253/g.369599  ORF Transcript_148253/g.369599 Transcript_148253/m.369599 type:complete len:538 (-) Transcript_148253:118-1731(-)|eukprot:CAMPEP_0115272296 /NCGR_PEP_ID=MMETSP0270-20121206/54547_1 /TAXON_ID=71861 /ORGANISM="Scrippsiella trochoidea, Strain CCMP3099" /LENGTH=537 /DNA_ID=CAMNT_0002688693 /DNA_START=20 /DNA_END=1633 /DNA_ORIENTATION=-
MANDKIVNPSLLGNMDGSANGTGAIVQSIAVASTLAIGSTAMKTTKRSNAETASVSPPSPVSKRSRSTLGEKEEEVAAAAVSNVEEAAAGDVGVISASFLTTEAALVASQKSCEAALAALAETGAVAQQLQRAHIEALQAVRASAPTLRALGLAVEEASCRASEQVAAARTAEASLGQVEVLLAETKQQREEADTVAAAAEERAKLKTELAVKAAEESAMAEEEANATKVAEEEAKTEAGLAAIKAADEKAKLEQAKTEVGLAAVKAADEKAKLEQAKVEAGLAAAKAADDKARLKAVADGAYENPKVEAGVAAAKTGHMARDEGEIAAGGAVKAANHAILGAPRTGSAMAAHSGCVGGEQTEQEAITPPSQVLGREPVPSPPKTPAFDLANPGEVLFRNAAQKLHVISTAVPDIVGEYRLLQGYSVHGRPAYRLAPSKSAGRTPSFLVWIPKDGGRWVITAETPTSAVGATGTPAGKPNDGTQRAELTVSEKALPLLARSLQIAWTTLPEELMPGSWRQSSWGEHGAKAQVIVMRG